MAQGLTSGNSDIKKAFEAFAEEQLNTPEGNMFQKDRVVLAGVDSSIHKTATRAVLDPKIIERRRGVVRAIVYAFTDFGNAPDRCIKFGGAINDSIKDR
ncbi:hypothetical protein BGX20_009623 [Mortierella sp. AD010]|nr:hypothetical protein BGX20_009623 [Mortierella sp. AD010]